MKRNGKDNVKKIDFSDEFLIESAEKRFAEGDYMGALQALNRQAETGKPNADAFAVYGDVYESIGRYENAADAWYRFLDTCNEADFGEGYEGLSICYMHMGDGFQADFYFRRMLEADGEGELPIDPSAEKRARMRVLPNGEEEFEEYLSDGQENMRKGDLEGAKDCFSRIPETSASYADAMGFYAMCLLLDGEEEGAEEICEKHLKTYPDNLQTLVTYCAALGTLDKKEAAKKTALKLYSLAPENGLDRFRAATALCETEQHKEAFEILSSLIEGEYFYDPSALWFYAVAAHNTGRDDEAIAALERRCVLYPRGAVAKFYLYRLRAAREGGEPVNMGYPYMLPTEEYARIVGGFLNALSVKSDAEATALMKGAEEDFRLAADVLEGRDEKTVTLAIRAAIRVRADWFVRETLLDYCAHPFVKFVALRELVARNEENNFGVVLLGLYYEFSTVEIEIGSRKRKEFLAAFGEAYSRFACLGGEWNGSKLAVAAEDVYATLEEANAFELMNERNELAAVIYREARIKGGVRGISKICALFNADEKGTKNILEYLL